nr:unnamed protein product [Naegleria fowleri]
MGQVVTTTSGGEDEESKPQSSSRLASPTTLHQFSVHKAASSSYHSKSPNDNNSTCNISHNTNIPSSRRRSSLPTSNSQLITSHQVFQPLSPQNGKQMKASMSHHVLPVTASHSAAATEEHHGESWNENIGKNLWNQQQSLESLNDHSHTSCSPNQREYENNGNNNSSKRSESLPIQGVSNSSSNFLRSMSHPQNVNPNTSKKKVGLKSVIDMKKNGYLTTKSGDEPSVNVSDSELSDEFSSTNLSPQVHSNPYRLSVVSSNSSLSGGSSSNNQTSSSSPMHNHHTNSSSSLIHALFPSLPIDRSKMSDEEFNMYKEVVSRPVFEKILKSKPLIAKCGYNEEYMKEFAFELSDEEELKRTYLTTDWVETAKLLKRTRSVEDGSIPLSVLQQHASMNEESNQSNAPPTSVTPSDPTSPSSAAENNDASSKEVIMLPTKSLLDQPHLSKRDSIASLEEALEKMVSDKEANTDLLKQELKIKLIITEIASNSSQKTLRQFLSPVLHKMNVLPEIGWFHSAILVGKWRLDFNDSSVVIPRKLVSQAAVITTDIESITTMQDLNRVIDGMAKCICKWNRNITYKQTGGDRVTTGNCQDFVEDLLEHIGVKMNLSGSMKKFVKRLRRTGKCSLVFEMDKKFREYFKMETKRVKFKSHEQLDLFVRKLLETCPTFSQTFPDEWILLQSFDRTYWLKHMTYSHIDEYKPCKVIRDNRGVQDCPFHEPEFIQILKD